MRDQNISKQKVYVTLEGYTKLSRRYDYICNQIAEKVIGDSYLPNLNQTKQTLDFVIETLSLPIDIRAAQAKPRPIPLSSITEIDEATKRYVESVKKVKGIIEAIKLVRSITGWPLRESKDYVDALDSKS